MTTATTTRQSAALSRLFTARVLNEFAKHQKSPLFARLVAESGLNLATGDNTTISEAFDEAFRTLRRKSHRTDYVYRSALAHNILLGKHSLSTANMMSEFRAGESKADLVVLNGTSTVYEIKSERDSLARLAKQIFDYQRVFASVYVIAGAAHIDGIASMVPNHIGLMKLTRWDRISKVREAIDCPEKIDPASVFLSLQTKEAALILERLGYGLPDLPNTAMRSALRDIFETLAPTELHDAMIGVLKQTRSLEPLSGYLSSLPKSLVAAGLIHKIPKRAQDNVIAALNKPLSQALAWA